jgi:AAA domain, putative AbiEii toxin, Type IV TA system
MRVTSVRLRNFRSFIDSGDIELGRISVLVGRNNEGKSSILRGLHQLQAGLGGDFADVRIGSSGAVVDIGLTEGADVRPWQASLQGENGPFLFSANITSGDRRSGNHSASITLAQRSIAVERLPPNEPDHFIVPFMSKRKAVEYVQDVREEFVDAVKQDVSNLAAKLSRLANPSYPFHSKYVQACTDILGFAVTTIPAVNGQLPGIYLPTGAHIPISQLGEGVPNIVLFLANLAVSQGKLFLVEEPENDIHPKALKALLDLIIDSSTLNQFVISTHSHIVVSHLCSSQHSRLYQVATRQNAIPVESAIAVVPDSPSERLAVLQDLGYELSDYELWDGWLILEESSAERIIRDFLIPWFAPNLTGIRTIAANGATKVGSLFEELHRLMLFTHLTPIYKEKSWVLVDGDPEGMAAVAQLIGKFPDYGPDRFKALEQRAFERYYPREFADRVEQTLALADMQQRRGSKRTLLDEVRNWLAENDERGRQALEVSAAEVIRVLKAIEAVVAAGPRR